MNLNPTKTEQLRTVTRFHLENMGISPGQKVSDQELVDMVRGLLRLEAEAAETEESPHYLKVSLIKAIAEAGGETLDVDATSVSRVSEVLQQVLRS